MKAIIIATGFCQEMGPLLGYRPTPLLNIADKPIIFHLIEALIRQGIKEYHLVTSHFPEQIEERLEDGKRWGIQINYHLAKNPSYPFSTLMPIIRGWGDQSVLLGQGDHFPKFPKLSKIARTPLFFYHKANLWSGWGIISSQQIARFSPRTNYDKVPELITNPAIEIVEPFLSVRGLRELKKSNRIFMAQETPSVIFPTTAKKVEPGVWISRAVVLEPGVQVKPPVFIGENTHIKAGARIGPNAVIENHCIIDSHSKIEDSVICQNSYVGEALEIQDCIIDRNSLMNLKLGTHLQLKDEFLLGTSQPPSLYPYVLGFFERGLALLVVFLIFPIYLFMNITCTKKRVKKLHLPASEDSSQWKTIELTTFVPHNFFQKFFCRIPYLFQIIKGKIHFVGLIPRSVSEMKKLPSEWLKLSLQSKIGWVTLASLDHGKNPSVDEQYASEVYYAVHQNWWFDIKIFIRWLWKKLKGMEDGD